MTKHPSRDSPTHLPPLFPSSASAERRDPPDHLTTAAAMRRVHGRPDFRVHVFDYVFDETDRPYTARLADRNRLIPSTPSIARRVHFLQPRELRCMADLLRFEAWCIAEGFEGVMLNAPGGIYKSGRCTEREGFLVKVKRFDDGRETAWETMRRDCGKRKADTGKK